MKQDLKPKKQLGQHWLHDEVVLRDIVELSDIELGELVVEVGPGLGTLTTFLLEAGADVTAVELDFELYEHLQKKAVETFGAESAQRLKIINEDILKFRFDQLLSDYKVVANIPYYLTSNLIRVLTESQKSPSIITLLIQKEVAERLCAEPGNMSLLSIWAQMYYECELGPLVPAALFTPPPKVDSQVVVMRRRDAPLCDGIDKRELRKIIQAGFSNKRKTLHNSLSAGLHLSKPETQTLLERSDLSLTARPQELTHEQWIQLTNNYLTR